MNRNFGFDGLKFVQAGETVSDVVIFPNTGYQLAILANNATPPPISDRFDLSSELWIGPVEDAERILDALTVNLQLNGPTDYTWINPVRQFSPLYAFVRENPPQNDPKGWDQLLLLCIALSRIVHPTSISYGYSARITRNSKGELIEVIPGPTSGPASETYIAHTERNWLTEEDARELKPLLKKYQGTPLTGPAFKALWYCEFAARQREADVRWTLIATGLDALVNTGPERSSRQFITRVPRLADKIGAARISRTKARKMWSVRSSLVHGQDLQALEKSDLELYVEAENLLRMVVRKAILEPDFASLLADRDRINREWPLEEPSGGEVF